MARLPRRIWYFVNRRRLERELDLEMAAHRAEMSDPRQFGSTLKLREEATDVWGWRWLDDLVRDGAYALRALRRAPGFTAVVLLTLGLGIGGNTAIFSVVNAVLIRPLPYEDADRIVLIGVSNLPRSVGSVMTTADIPLWRERARALTDLSVYSQASVTLAWREEPVRLEAARVSVSLFRLLGVLPVYGRGFAGGEDTPGAAPVAIVSHSVWRQYLGEDSDIVGRPVTIDGAPVTIVGIMPAEFHFPSPSTEIWLPYVITSPNIAVFPVARIAAGVSAEAATEEANTIYRQVFLSQNGRLPREGNRRLTLVPFKELSVARARTALLVLQAAVGIVLLIACCNVASLGTAWAAGRRRELEVRAALGAGIPRLIRQLLTEHLILGFAGGVVGLLVGYAILRPLGSWVWGTIPRFEEVRMDAAVLVFTFAVAILAGLVTGIVPALGLLRQRQVGTPPYGTLQGGDGVGSRQRIQQLLVIAEVGCATVLLVAAGLVVGSYVNVATLPLGFDPAGVMTVRVPLSSSYSDAEASVFNDNLLARLKELPGVQSAAITASLPLMPGGVSTNARASGSTERFGIRVHWVSNEYFGVFGMRAVSGRVLGELDDAGAPKVAVINRTMARTQFGGDPIDKTFTLGGEEGVFGASVWEVIGVVDDVQSFRLDAEPVAEVYLDVRQWPADYPFPRPTTAPTFALKLADGASASMLPTIRSIVRQMDSQVALGEARMFDERVAAFASTYRLNATRMGLLAALAGVLAAVGIFGLVAYAVTARTYEIGVRLALGAQRLGVLRTFVGRSVALAFGGIVLGCLGAAGLTRYLESLLFGVTPLDAEIFILVALGLLAIAALASYLPARRATTIDPVVALRAE